MPQCSHPPHPHSRNNRPLWLSTLSLSAVFSIQLNKSPWQVSKLSGSDDSSERMHCYRRGKKMITIVWSPWCFTHPFCVLSTSVKLCFTPFRLGITERWAQVLCVVYQSSEGEDSQWNHNLASVLVKYITHPGWSNLRTEQKSNLSCLFHLLAIIKTCSNEFLGGSFPGFLSSQNPAELLQQNNHSVTSWHSESDSILKDKDLKIFKSLVSTCRTVLIKGRSRPQLNNKQYWFIFYMKPELDFGWSQMT